MILNKGRRQNPHPRLKGDILSADLRFWMVGCFYIILKKRACKKAPSDLEWGKGGVFSADHSRSSSWIAILTASLIVAMFAMFCFCVVAIVQCSYPAHVAPNLPCFVVPAHRSLRLFLLRALRSPTSVPRENSTPEKDFSLYPFIIKKLGIAEHPRRKYFPFKKIVFYYHY